MALKVKYGGRKAGTPNKVTANLRQSVTSFLSANWSDVQANFDELEAKEKLAFIEKLLKYSLPQLQAVQMDVNAEINALPLEQLEQLFEKITSVYE